MDEAAKAAVLSAVRIILVTLGSVLTTKGVVDSETVNTIIGAAMVIIPAGWGIWSNFHQSRKADQREATALNCGIALSNQTSMTTEPVPAAQAKEVIRQFSPPPEGVIPS